MPKYIDIHAHTNFKAFEEDRDEVISRALESDTWVINIGTQYDTSKKAVEMTNEYGEGVYACIGLNLFLVEKFLIKISTESLQNRGR
ncbi:MAG: Hydrolase, TatD family [Candidatus Nomurabacteria bacterium GW2011_GWF1_34_20]|nr:MAG: Hydrolase, TatD family [Candidatus Nomurabacteria bacterium GW2011_GWF1_34_20]